MTRVGEGASKITKILRFVSYLGQVRGHASKTSGPMGGGQPKVDDNGRRGGGGRSLNRTSISENCEQIFCVSDSENPNPPPPVHGRPDRNILRPDPDILRFERFSNAFA